MSLGRTEKPSRDLNPAHNFLLHASQRIYIRKVSAKLPDRQCDPESFIIFLPSLFSVEDVGGDAILQRDRVGNQ